ncbi:MAG: hypothetical protein ACRD5Z_04105 [Bryobacteraceae bacterium]
MTSRVVLDRNESRQNRQGPAPLERAMGRNSVKKVPNNQRDEALDGPAMTHS